MVHPDIAALRRIAEAEEERRRQNRKQQKATRSAIRSRGLECAPLPPISVAHAMAAGLDEAAAATLAEASVKFGSGVAFRKPDLMSKNQRRRVRDIALDVLALVGLGKVDRLVLNHYIREVLRRVLSGYPEKEAATHLAPWLLNVLAKPNFPARALEALERHLGELSERQPTRRAAHERGAVITRQWIKDGGWRAYRFALDVYRCVDGRFTMSGGSSVPLSVALAVALGYGAAGLPRYFLGEEQD